MKKYIIGFLIALLTPLTAFAALGDINYGSTTYPITVPLHIGATSTCLISGGSIPQWGSCSGATSTNFFSNSGATTTLTTGSVLQATTATTSNLFSTSATFGNTGQAQITSIGTIYTTGVLEAASGNFEIDSVGGLVDLYNGPSYFQYGPLGIGTTSPSKTLTVAGAEQLTGAFNDSTNASGTNGQVLQSTGTSTLWVATSSLGFSSGSSTSITGDVIILHSNGSETGFTATSTASTSRGIALLNAVASSTGGDTIIPSCNEIFNLKTKNIILPNNVNFRGCGDASPIYSQANLFAVGPIFVPGNNSIVSDITIFGNEATSTVDAAYGWSNYIINNPVPASSTLIRLHSNTAEFGIYNYNENGATTTTQNIYDSVINDCGTGFQLGDQNSPTTNIYNTVINSSYGYTSGFNGGCSAANNGLQGFGSNGGTGVTNISGGSITANASSTDSGASANAVYTGPGTFMTVHLSGVRLVSSGENDLDISNYNDNCSIIVNGSSFDTSKTSPLLTSFFVSPTTVLGGSASILSSSQQPVISDLMGDGTDDGSDYNAGDKITYNVYSFVNGIDGIVYSLPASSTYTVAVTGEDVFFNISNASANLLGYKVVEYINGVLQDYSAVSIENYTSESVQDFSILGGDGALIFNNAGSFGLWNPENPPVTTPNVPYYIGGINVSNDQNAQFGTSTCLAAFCVQNNYGTTSDIADFFDSNGNQIGSILENGNWGIGTDNPTSKLTINGTSDQVQLTVAANSTQTHDTEDWLNTSGSVTARVQSGGGTTYIDAQNLRAIPLGGGSDAAVQVWKDTTPSAAISFGMNIPGHSITNDLYFSMFNGSSWASNFMESQAGNLGIGTTTPASTITLVGTESISSSTKPTTSYAGDFLCYTTGNVIGHMTQTAGVGSGTCLPN